MQHRLKLQIHRSNPTEVLLGKRVLKICSKFTGEQLLCNFIETILRNGCSPVNFLHIFRTPFSKNTSGELLLDSSHPFFYSLKQVSCSSSASTGIYVLQGFVLESLSFLAYITILAIISGQMQKILLTTLYSCFSWKQIF